MDENTPDHIKNPVITPPEDPHLVSPSASQLSVNKSKRPAKKLLSLAILFIVFIISGAATYRGYNKSSPAKEQTTPTHQVNPSDEAASSYARQSLKVDRDLETATTSAELNNAITSARKKNVVQMSNALTAYTKDYNVLYPNYSPDSSDCVGNSGAGWITDCLLASNEIAAVPKNREYTDIDVKSCDELSDSAAENNLCYKVSEDRLAAMVFATLEGPVDREKCFGISEITWFVHTAKTGSGVFCNNAPPDFSATKEDLIQTL
jgi:hypothetical protein